MRQKFRRQITTIMLLFTASALLIMGVVTVQAWQTDGGELVTGQASFGTIASANTKLTYTYTVSDSQAVTVQVVGEVAQPTITILKAGQPVATQANAEGSKNVSLMAVLDAGSYAVEIGTVNNTVGTVIVVVQTEAPITTGALPLAKVIVGEVTSSADLATYTFTGQSEPAYLYFENTLPTGGATLHLKNAATGSDSIVNGTDMSGARFRIPAGSTAYEIDVAYTATDQQKQTFSLCLALISANSCEAGNVPQTTSGDTSAPTPDTSNPSACSITPLNTNGANIRKTADTASPVIVGLPNGESASVIGVSPAGNFFKVSYKNATGWVAQVAVSSSGDCSGVPVVNPPAFVPTPTPIPPTPIPPTQPPEPTGPCLITLSDKLLIYTQPNAIPDYIFDQVQNGYQLIPVGKLKNNSWWKTNYNGSWIETKHFGHEAHVSGNCKNLPVISP